MTKKIIIQRGKDLFNGRERRREPRQMFGKFLYEGELGVLFGDSNAGKSILANDIAFFVSGKGHVWEGMTSPEIPSLYIDMEMSGEQFASRYACAMDYIPETYSRAEVDVLSCDNLFNSIKISIIKQQASDNAPKFIVIDNITNGFGSIYSASQMRALIAELKSLKQRYGLTILIIAHCPKRREGKPITQDNLGGSKMLMNFVDSAFAIGTSMIEEGVRYIKQIKTREDKKYDDVMTVDIVDEPYLSFRFKEWTCEEEHIDKSHENKLNIMEYITPEVEPRLIALLTDTDKKIRDVAAELGLHSYIVYRYALYNQLRDTDEMLYQL